MPRTMPLLAVALGEVATMVCLVSGFVALSPYGLRETALLGRMASLYGIFGALILLGQGLWTLRRERLPLAALPRILVRPVPLRPFGADRPTLLAILGQALFVAVVLLVTARTSSTFRFAYHPAGVPLLAFAAVGNVLFKRERRSRYAVSPDVPIVPAV